MCDVTYLHPIVVVNWFLLYFVYFQRYIAGLFSRFAELKLGGLRSVFKGWQLVKLMQILQNCSSDGYFDNIYIYAAQKYRLIDGFWKKINIFMFFSFFFIFPNKGLEHNKSTHIFSTLFIEMQVRK